MAGAQSLGRSVVYSYTYKALIPLVLPFSNGPHPARQYRPHPALQYNPHPSLQYYPHPALQIIELSELNPPICKTEY